MGNIWKSMEANQQPSRQKNTFIAEMWSYTKWDYNRLDKVPIIWIVENWLLEHTKHCGGCYIMAAGFKNKFGHFF